MERKLDFSVRNILVITATSALLVAIYGMIKWYIELRRRTRRIFHKVRTYRRPSYHPIVGHAFKFIGTPTQMHRKMMKACFEYGPNFVIWLVDKVVIIVGKPEDVEKMLQSPNCLEKNELYRFTQDLVGTGIFSAPVSKWRRTRKIINRTFNAKILEGYQQTFCDTASLLADEILPKYVDKNDVDWYMIFTAETLDTITQTAMGVKTETQGKGIPFGQWMEEGMRAIFVRMMQMLYFPDLIFFRTNLGKQLLHSREKIFRFTEEIINERRNKFKTDLKNGEYQPVFDEGSQSTGLTSKKAFLDFLIELDHRGMKFTDVELRDEINTFILGGTDTTAITSCFFLLMMAMHPEIQEEVHQEVMKVLGPDRLPTANDLNELHLTERCIKETMRLFAPAPIILRHNTGGDVQLSDGVIPEGASCGVSFYYLHRSELYWKDPLKFDPDRFLPEEVAKRHPYTFLPFSAGLRGCIGRRYALKNLKTLLSLIIRKYKTYSDAYKSIEEIELKNVMVLRPIDGFKFSMQMRKMCH